MNKKFSIIEFAVFLISLVLILSGFLVSDRNLIMGIFGVGMVSLFLLFHIYTPQIAGLSEGNAKVKTMRRINLFSVIMIAVCFLVMELEVARGIRNQEIIELCIILGLILVLGNTAPKLPFNRNIGLRLPWTIRDEKTWKVAHKLLGYLSFPVAFVIMAGALSGYTKQFAIGGILLWILVPGVYSLFFYVMRLNGNK